MRQLTITTLVLSLFTAACNTTTQRSIVDADPDARVALLSSVTSLAGRWEGEGSDGKPTFSSFSVSSGGSAVREVMAVGTPFEMTNMYTLDGDGLVMTHYCAMGNQPSMRASGVEDGRVAFRFEGVKDLGAADEIYMGEMTLVLIDENHIEQHWRAFKGGELDHEMVISMERR